MQRISSSAAGIVAPLFIALSDITAANRERWRPAAADIRPNPLGQESVIFVAS